MTFRLPSSRRAALWLAATIVAACSSADQLGGPRVAPDRARLDISDAAQRLVIVEVMADNKVTNDVGEYFKVFNPGPSAVDIKSLVIQSASGTTVYHGAQTVESHTISAASTVSIPVGGCAVLSNSSSSTANGGVTNVAYQYTSITLGNNNTDWLTIKTSTGRLLDSVAYSTSTIDSSAATWTRTITTPSYTPPSASPTSGTARSRIVVDPSIDHAVMAGTNWVNATTEYSTGNNGAPTVCDYTWRVTGGGGTVIGPLDHVTVSGASTVVAGGTTTFSALAKDAANHTVSTATITWSSSNPATASVDPTSGVVTGVAASATPVTITATAVDGDVTRTGSAQITVTTPSINWLDISLSATTVLPGFQAQLFATARAGQNGTVIPATFTFEALDPTLATIIPISNTGIITGVAAPSDGVTKARFRITATPVGGGTPYTFTTTNNTGSMLVEAAVSAATSIYADNDEFGDPTPATASSTTDQLIVRSQYTLSYNQSRGTPNWVSYELDSRQFGAEDRCNCFSADPNLPADKRIYTSDYTNGGYDRGHMTRSADRTAANMDNAVTYYLTNVVPQLADLNQGVWAQFENALADSARAGRAVYIITGPLYSRSHGLTFLKNEGKVAIPDSTWKIAIIGPRTKGAPFTLGSLQGWTDLAGVSVLAVNMPNVSGIRNTPWSTYLTTIDRIETATGYDFLSLLPVAFQTPLEAGDHAPAARFAVTGTPNEGSTLTFDASATTDADLGRTDLDRTEALTYVWHFSDGANASGQIVTHVFGDNGAHTATLTVSDAYGWQNVAAQTVTVANVAPTASFTATSPLTILSGQSVSVTGGFTDPGADAPWQYQIAWGSGSPQTGTLAASGATVSATHQYLTAGDYTARFTVTDKDGASDSRMLAVSVARVPVAGSADPVVIEANETGIALVSIRLASTTVDVRTIDASSVRIGSVAPLRGHLDMAEGSPRMSFDFSRNELVRAGLLSTETTELVLTANLENGMQIVSRVAVSVR